MAGKTGREVAELWEVDSITPLFNQTIVEGPHQGNVSSVRLPVEWHQLPTNLSHISPSGMSSMLTSRVHSTAHVSAPTMKETVATTSSITTTDLLETSPQPATIRLQSQTTAERPETTRGPAQPTQRGATRDDKTTQTEDKSTRTLAPPTTPRQAPTESVPPTTGTIQPGTAPAEPTSSPVRSQTQLPSAAEHQSTTTRFMTSSAFPSRPAPSSPTPPPTLARRTTEPPTRRTTIPSKSEETEKPGCPWRRQELTDISASGSTTTVSAHKLQPCVLELCKFFSQCLCRPFSHKTRMKRYCDDSHVWYEKHTSEVCRRVRRVSFSRNLKQRCLMKMCNKL